MSSADLEVRLVEIVRADPGLMHVLKGVREQGRADWRILPGAVCERVWEALAGRARGVAKRKPSRSWLLPTRTGRTRRRSPPRTPAAAATARATPGAPQIRVTSALWQ